MAKTISILFSVALALGAQQLATVLKRAGALPAQQSDASALSVPSQSQQFFSVNNR